MNKIIKLLIIIYLITFLGFLVLYLSGEKTPAGQALTDGYDDPRIVRDWTGDTVYDPGW